VVTSARLGAGLRATARARAALGATALAATALVLAVAPSPARAGCGCDKPPPPPAAVRPHFGSPGDTVTFFASKLVPGKRYRVEFGDDAAVYGTAERKRDLADGLVKPQLNVRVPSLTPGPVAISVKDGWKEVLDLSRSDFTALQRPLALSEANVDTRVRCYSAAVGRDGTVYIPVDVGAIAERTIFSGVGEQFPLLFSARDVVIYNTQGFVMQLLGPAEADIYEIRDVGAPHSFELTYDRHEFVTYREQHVHEGALALDAADPAWHADGTPHVDHDHLVIAIQGTLEGSGRPRSGSTAPFDLDVLTVVDGGAVSSRTIQWSNVCGSRGSGWSGFGWSGFGW